MTAAMHRLHRRLGRRNRYPLPPREIVGAAIPGLPGVPATDATLVAHFAYGAASGALLAAVARKPTIGEGMAGGLAIWVASYMGWIPAFGILKPANRHPGDRNALMAFVHLIWGSAFAIAHRDLLESRSAFDRGLLKDVKNSGRSRPPSAEQRDPFGQDSVSDK